jgi:general stress protein 26
MTTIEKAERLYRKVNTFFLSCVGSDGYPLTKAVVPGKHRESLREMFFCTNTSSRLATEISRNPKSSVYFYSRKIFWFKGCYLKGSMEIVTDMGIKEKYWQDFYKNAYPQKSFTDPDFCVLRFTPVSGRLYGDFKLSDFEI